MSLNRVDIHAVRNIHSAQLFLSPHINIITGKNASGKTSLLEAVYLLGHGKSFRSHQIREIIQYKHDQFQLFGIIQNGDREISIGLARDRSGRPRVRISGQQSHRIAELTQLLPIQVMTPDVHGLIESSPSDRRAFIDWGVFHVEHDYFDVWQRYRHLLKQRNAALRSNQYDQSMDHYWLDQLAKLGQQVQDFRASYIEQLLPYLNTNVERVLGDLRLSFVFKRGWKEDISLQQALSADEPRDRQQGFTRFGPHRADLLVQVDDKPAAHHLSRGQQKLVVAAMKMAQVALLNQNTERRALVMIDDLPAELDEINRSLLFNLLSGFDNQVLITATDDSLVRFNEPKEQRGFHVEQGCITPV